MAIPNLVIQPIFCGSKIISLNFSFPFDASMFVEPTIDLFDVTHFFLNSIKVSYLVATIAKSSFLLLTNSKVFDFHEN
jgi:hypothetical protein